MIYSSWGACKHYHSDLVQRSQILLMALTGNQGRSGGGLRVASWWPVEGFDRLAAGPGEFGLGTRLKVMARALLGRFGWREFEQLLQDRVPERGNTPLMPWLYVHGGYAEIWDRREYQDPSVPRATSARTCASALISREHVPVEVTVHAAMNTPAADSPPAVPVPLMAIAPSTDETLPPLMPAN